MLIGTVVVAVGSNLDLSALSQWWFSKVLGWVWPACKRQTDPDRRYLRFVFRCWQPQIVKSITAAGPLGISTRTFAESVTHTTCNQAGMAKSVSLDWSDPAGELQSHWMVKWALACLSC